MSLARWKNFILPGILLGFFLLLVLATVAIPLYESKRFADVKLEMTERVRALKARRPADMTAPAWGCAVDWTDTAIANICVTPDYVSYESLRRLDDAIAEKSKGPIDLDTLQWIWNELDKMQLEGKYGSYYVRQGGTYIERHKPFFLKEVAQVNATVRVGAWEARRPADMTTSAWESAIKWTHRAILNIRGAPGHVSYESWRRLNDAIVEKGKGPVDFDTLLWIWDELEKMEPDGKDGGYVEKSRPFFLKQVAEANAPKDAKRQRLRSIPN